MLIGAVWWYTRVAPSQYLMIMLRSRYQFGTLVVREVSLATARSEKLTGDRPGGHERHFCVPLYITSQPHSSIATGMPPRLVTVSTRYSAPVGFTMEPISATGLRTPVDVSAWTTATIR